MEVFALGASLANTFLAASLAVVLAPVFFFQRIGVDHEIAALGALSYPFFARRVSLTRFSSSAHWSMQ